MRRVRGLNYVSIQETMYLSPVETIGHDTQATSAGSFNRFTQEIVMTAPFFLEMVRWDINTADTYSLQLVDSTGASPSILKTLASGVSLTGGGAENAIVVPPTLLMPGTHYLSLFSSTPRQQRRNSTNVVNFGAFAYISVGYDGTAPTTGSIPAKLVGCYHKWRFSFT